MVGAVLSSGSSDNDLKLHVPSTATKEKVGRSLRWGSTGRSGALVQVGTRALAHPNVPSSPQDDPWSLFRLPFSFLSQQGKM